MGAGAAAGRGGNGGGAVRQMTLPQPIFSPAEGECVLPLTRGYSTLVSIVDYPRISEHKWFAQINASGVYAARVAREGALRRKLYLHRWLVGDAPQVDHRNRVTLDNTRRNLIASTPVYNCHNRDVEVGASGYRGVYKVGRRFRAKIKFSGAEVCLGTYDTAVEAAAAYDARAREYLGSYAWANLPRVVDEGVEDIPI